MEFFETLNFVINFAVWGIKNLDLLLGGFSLLAVFLNSGAGISNLPLILMAIVGLGIRIARIVLKKMNN